MDPTFTWLSISLFCNKNNWNTLLGQAISTFVASDEKINSYTIEFNYLSGQNIRLSLKVNEFDAPAVAQYAHNYFRTHFSNSDYAVNKIKFPVDGVFMPFPMNTIQFGLYKIQDINPGIESVSIELSKIAITALKDDSIDDETIITFAFYLQVSLIKAILNYTGDTTGLLSMINQFNPANEVGESAIVDQSLMDEITLDVMHTVEFDSELNWLNDWVKLATGALQQLNVNERINLEEFYHIRVIAVCKCLGLNSDSRALLGNLVKISLAQYLLNSTKHLITYN